MKYLLMIYANEAEQSQMTEADMNQSIADYMAFTDGVRKSGNYVAGEALQPTPTATTVRVRNGKIVRTDGPFAETKEQLGGYYLVEAKDLDEAIAIAAKIPDAKGGAVEVRPIMVFDNM